jgi:hypothetical protein
LPSVLIGTVSSTAIHCTFGSTSLYRDGTADGNPEASALFNPNVPNVFNVSNAGGTVTLNLGIIVTIPATAVTDTYQGVVSCTATITGL